MSILNSKIALLSAVILLLLSGFSAILIWRYPAWGMQHYVNRVQESLTIEGAVELAEEYLETLGNKDLAIDEIMEFELNFYIVFYEKSTGIGAFEAILDKQWKGGMMSMMMYGYIRPEQGPNMMWNAKYGMHRAMHGNAISSGAMITEVMAQAYGRAYLDNNLPGLMVEDVHPFYGYYTIHVVEEGNVYGMLSVNGYNGQVWYHTWHGKYIQSFEMHE